MLGLPRHAKPALALCDDHRHAAAATMTRKALGNRGSGQGLACKT